MSLKAGIVGLPNVGKSTLFNAITNSRVEAANYPFATIEPNVGVVKLKDSRIDKLASLVRPEKVIYSTFQFIDIAGLIAGASKGEGLGNKFLDNIKNVDAIIHVVRCFDDKKITHVFSDVDVKRDVDIINLELILADLQLVSSYLDRNLKKAIANTDKNLKFTVQVAQKVLSILQEEKPLRNASLEDAELQTLKSFNLLTLKPMLYVANINEKDIRNPFGAPHYKILVNYTQHENTKVVPISSRVEQEISEIINAEEQQVFFEDLGIQESGLNALTRATFEILNLSTFFTAGEKEVRAWEFKTNSLAPICAGVIHSDFEKGFIKVEVIKYDDFIKYGSRNGVKEAGKIQIEGRNYVMQDGDICLFRFSN